jgi:hypothetical protein
MDIYICVEGIRFYVEKVDLKDIVNNEKNSKIIVFAEDLLNN